MPKTNKENDSVIYITTYDDEPNIYTNNEVIKDFFRGDDFYALKISTVHNPSGITTILFQKLSKEKTEELLNESL